MIFYKILIMKYLILSYLICYKNFLILLMMFLLKILLYQKVLLIIPLINNAIGLLLITILILILNSSIYKNLWNGWLDKKKLVNPILLISNLFFLWKRNNVLLVLKSYLMKKYILRVLGILKKLWPIVKKLKDVLKVLGLLEYFLLMNLDIDMLIIFQWLILCLILMPTLINLLRINMFNFKRLLL